MYDKRLGIHQAYAERLEEMFPGRVFATRVPLAAHYKEAISARLPISHYKPKSPSAKIYEQLADEVEARITQLAEVA
jgi:cellulose biosynthesis protein BcsQ